MSTNPAIGLDHSRQEVRLALIRIDGGTQPREEIDVDTVDRYAEDMLAGDEFPPLKVFFDGIDHWLADGFHRLFAYKKIGVTEADCTVYQGTARDAILDSLGANSIHGLPRSPEDKRLAVQRLLTDSEWSAWSDGVIAQKANVSQPFVSKLRRALPLLDGPTQNVLSESQAPPPTVERRGADNRVIKTSNIGRKKDAVTPGKTDLALFPVSNEEKKTGNAARVELDPPGWSEISLTIGLVLLPGKSDRRKLQISGRAGQGAPLFRVGFTAADLSPMPAPLEAIVAELKAAYSKALAKTSGTIKPAKSKSKPKAKATPSKKPTPAREKPATKK